MTKIAGSGSGSVSQRHGSSDPDPDPPQNVMDPQHCHQEVPAVAQLCLQADCGEPPALRPRHGRTESGGLPLRGSPALQVVQPDAVLPVGPGWYGTALLKPQYS
jgi:hypothetical protein